jgi:Leucine-rich repeat (LRR) protein
LSDVPQWEPSSKVWDVLDLGGNSFDQLKNTSFEGILAKRLFLDYCQLESNEENIESGVFVPLSGILEELVLYQNERFKHLESRYMQYLPNLKKLDVSRCDLSVDTLELNGLYGLEVLDIYDNKISDLTGVMFADQGNLKELYAQSNGITTIRKSFTHNVPSLKILDLYSNQIPSFENGSLEQLEKVTELNLGINHLPYFPKQETAELHNLETLNMWANKINQFNSDDLWYLH